MSYYFTLNKSSNGIPVIKILICDKSFVNLINNFSSKISKNLITTTEKQLTDLFSFELLIILKRSNVQSY